MENIGRKIGQKTEFSSVWEQRENRKGGKPGRKFSLPGPQIFSSQIGRKSHERKLPHCTFTIMPSPDDYNNSARQNITTQPPNPAPPPNTTTQHKKLTQNQQKINGKTIRKPNSKSLPKITALNQTHPKIIIYNKSIKLKL